VIPGRPALLVWRGDPRPSRTAPLEEEERV